MYDLVRYYSKKEWQTIGPTTGTHSCLVLLLYNGHLSSSQQLSYPAKVTDRHHIKTFSFTRTQRRVPQTIQHRHVEMHRPGRADMLHLNETRYNAAYAFRSTCQ